MRLAWHSLGLLLAGAVVFLLHPAARTQDRASELRAEFERETSPVSKAKVFKKLGPIEFDELRKLLDAGQDARALHTLEQYRDQARTTLDALKALKVDAERKPGGFKPLQIELREGLRRLDEVILAMPVNDRDAFRAVRADLAKMQDELLDLLFPRQPGKTPPKEKKG